MTDEVLSLERFGIAFGRRVVLASVDLEVPARGVTSLMGPVGVGKSTLLRTLAGRNDAEPSLRTWGRATYRGVAWRTIAFPGLVGQGARVLVGTVLDCIAGALPNRAKLQRSEQRARAVELLETSGMADLVARLDESAIELSKGDLRRVSLATAMVCDPGLLLVDEPTAGLRDQERATVLEVVRRRAETSAVLLVTHSRADALALPGTTALLAGGAIVEHTETSTFFQAPRSPITQAFVETGSCAVSGPPSLDELVADGLVPSTHLVSADRAAEAQSGTWSAFPDPPLALRWVLEGRLAGVRRPGLLGSVDRDLQTLAAAGVQLLVCLEESQVLSADLLGRYGIESHAAPIVDMDAPTLEEARAICALLDQALDARRVVAVHCRAGLGRTGTILCAWLLWKGLDRERALSRVRTVEPRFVQSERQLEFLADFEAALRAEARTRTTSHPPFA